ncbi:hypothetical protein DZC73_18830 [Albitalea terrae]|uniref:Restriction endonuclease type IV Mrr domain-containing protein n=2 Tax=Piscinibacter terrae TaxID=2496871 RepID=A0A3N7HQW4_9BURK|nr:hypothetical protein DZC73_18830 [Albitalea terrae]
MSIDLEADHAQEIVPAVIATLQLWRRAVEQAACSLRRFQWKSEYETNEQLFTKNVVIPLLQKAGYDHVRYNHGISERGKDVLFSEIDKFGRIRHCAAQVKAGDLSQSNATLLNALLNQIDDAFSLPVRGPGQNEQYYIADLYIVVSGKITSEAIERLNGKLDRRLIGSVHFFDRSHIESLAGSLWQRR